MDWIILSAALGFALHGAKYAWRWHQKRTPWADARLGQRLIIIASMALTAVAIVPLVPILTFAALAEIVIEAGESSDA